MERLNFDSQRLPPFLVGYFIDSKVGEREIVASIMNLIIRGNLFLKKKEDGYYLRKIKPNPKNRFEELILEQVDEEEASTIDIMIKMRSRNKEIYEGFKDYLETRYHELTEKKKSNFFLSFSFKLFSGDKVLHELERTYGENRILPILPEEDKKSLLELTRFLKEHPVDEENVAAEFMPYSVALGLNNFWMRQFRADPKQRSVPLDFDDMDFDKEFDMGDEPKEGTGLSFSISSKKVVREEHHFEDD